MNIEFHDRLLFTSIEIAYKGHSKILDNIVIDTGAASSIISPDAVDDIGVYAELGDRIVEYYGVGGSVHIFFVKSLNEIKIGSCCMNNIEIDFGMIDVNGEINGLLGLDLLIEVGAIIDLKKLMLRIE